MVLLWLEIIYSLTFMTRGKPCLHLYSRTDTILLDNIYSQLATISDVLQSFIDHRCISMIHS